MKTIKVVFVSTIPTSLEEVENRHQQQYTFNSKNGLYVGDVIKTERYTGYLVVVEVCSYLHFYISDRGVTSEKREEVTDRTLSTLAEMGNDEQYDIAYVMLTTLK